MGEYKRAEPLLKQALELRKQLLGAEHPDYAVSLHSLAVLYSATREFTRAAPLYLEVLEIRKKVFGREHVKYAESLANLGALYWLMDDYDRAEPPLREAHQIRETLLGAEHPMCASSLNNLAALSMSRGDYEPAEALYRRALEIKARAPGGAELPDYANNLVDLAILYLLTDRPAEGLTCVQQGLQVQQAHLEQVLPGTAESAMRDYLHTNRASLITLLSIAAAPAAPDEALDATFTWMLRRKAALLDVLCRLREVQTLLGQDPLVRDQVTRLRGLRQQLSNAALNPPRGLDADQLRAQITELNEQVNRLEAELHLGLTADLDEALTRQISLDQIRGRLPEECVLVEFVRGPIFDFHAPENKLRVKSARYFAFILAAASDVPPQLLDLGEAAAIDQAIQDWRAGVASNSELIDGSVLRELLWAPLAEYVGEAKTILVAPDGELNRLPFEALTDEGDSYLIEHYQFAYLSSGRDLLRNYGEAGRGAIVFADPDYDLGAQARHAAAQTLLASLEGADVALRGALTPDVRGLTWDRLPGFASEAEAVASSLDGTRFAPVKQYAGAEALEEVFKSQSAPRLLHLITHGFFVPDQTSNLEEQPGLGEVRGEFGAAEGLARLRGTENPLLRSGIVLAGANALGAESDIAADDGWVTAEEISQMDLRGTDLVVLSACETGLGDVRTGEGVYGLRRAFFHGGAKTLITSLFKVPDEATSLLMRRFYRNLCTKEMTPLAALREAQLFVLNGGEDPDVDPIPSNTERRPPRDWAAFVLSGDWR
jgi:CHAT domain-containing protein